MDKRQVAKDARKEIIIKWQKYWGEGRWIYAIINNVEKWTNKGHGE